MIGAESINILVCYNLAFGSTQAFLGVDSSSGMLDEAQKKARDDPAVVLPKDSSFQIMDATRLSIPDRSVCPLSAIKSY